MRSVLVCASRSHGNTAAVAEVMAEALGSHVVDVSEFAPLRTVEYDLVGFGSGIYGMSFDDELRRLVASLPPGRGTEAFVFATSGFGRINERPFRPRLASMLDAAGYPVVGTFCCRGLDTWLPLRLVGGLNRGHPDASDLERARAFATRLRDRPAQIAPARDRSSLRVPRGERERVRSRGGHRTDG